MPLSAGFKAFCASFDMAKRGGRLADRNSAAKVSQVENPSVSQNE
jgi:hypothetical protein